MAADEATAPWTALTDALMARAVLRFRSRRGWPPDPFAGIRIDDASVDDLLAELVGGTIADHDEAAADAMVASAREVFRAGLAAAGPIGVLASRAGLDETGAEVLGLLCAVELDVRRQLLVAYLQDDVTRRRPTLHTLRSLFDGAGALAVAHDAPLRRAHLVDVTGDGPWADRVVAVHPTVVWALVGDRSPDPDLPLRATTASAIDDDTSGGWLTVVSGTDRMRRLQAAVSNTAGTEFLVTPLPDDDRRWAAVIREATLGGFGVVVEAGDDLPDAGRHAIERTGHLPWSICSKADLPLDSLPRRPWLQVRASEEPPDDDEWAGALGSDVTRRHELGAEQLRLVASAYEAVGSDLDAAVRRLASGRIDHLARRIRPERTWDDLILADDKVEQLREIVARYRHQDVVYRGWGFRASPSTGLVALFSGPSGTGKTMAAEIIAGDLALDLFKLDLSAVVSKYIGETEKNLDEVFDAAEAGNVVLFFDEADALFGKRSEVSDAHDRYANIEVSYLLQRLEAYDGVVVLATNLQKNIDQAFLRRLHAVVEFPTPDEPERRRIWDNNLPPEAPTKAVDLDFLARQFTLTGGSIRNVALTAAFLAADAGTAITMEAIVLALRREFQKLGRLVTHSDFGEYYDLVAPTR